MKGVVFEEMGVEPKVVDNLEKPSPGADQLLVKSVWIAINPVDTFIASYGILVVNWPLVLGVDAGGVVVEVGKEAASKYGFQAGDEVFGCTRLGSLGYSAGQEYFLMDARVTIPKPNNISLIEAATLGVASETACLGLFDGLSMTLPDPKNLPPAQDEWIVILGGASSVGRSAVQLAKACGYKVAASCSSKSAASVKELEAIPFDYKKSIDEQVKEVMEITSGKVARIFDAVAADDPVLPREQVELGPVGRPEADDLNAKIASYIPVIVGLIQSGKLLPGEYEVIGEGGFDDAVKAYTHQRSGAGGSRKVVVRVSR